MKVFTTTELSLHGFLTHWQLCHIFQDCMSLHVLASLLQLTLKCLGDTLIKSEFSFHVTDTQGISQIVIFSVLTTAAIEEIYETGLKLQNGFSLFLGAVCVSMSCNLLCISDLKLACCSKTNK